nr:molybdenum cofactor biosynthesis protein MoaE [Propionibacteriales bacterium]
MADVIRFLGVSDGPLDIAQLYASVQDPRAGGVAVFVGAVRDHDQGKSVTQLDYTAHPSVHATMRSVADDVVARYDVIALAAVHRI